MLIVVHALAGFFAIVALAAAVVHTVSVFRLWRIDRGERGANSRESSGVLRNVLKRRRNLCFRIGLISCSMILVLLAIAFKKFY